MKHWPDDALPAGVSRDFPSGDALRARYLGRDDPTLRAVREARFARVMARAWKVPFYQRLWGDAGIEPGDVRAPDDIHRLPTYSKADLAASIERCPPFGDFAGDAITRGCIMHTTSGTTGTPQPLYFGARDRETQNALLARAYALHGLRAGDIALSVYGFGMVNGGHYVREAVTRYTDALLLPAGTGLETPSAQVVQMLERYGVSALLGFGDYLLKLGQLATDAGLAERDALRVRIVSGHLDHGLRDKLSSLWNGAECYDWYGVGDTGIVASETRSRDGLSVFEDAHHVDIVDPDSGAPVGPGMRGNICVTCLFKDDVYPIVRFDTQDVSMWLDGATPELPAFGRIAGFLGRSDDMVKLRGINVYPTAIGALLGFDARCTGEYLCRLRREGEREALRIDVEWAGDAAQADAARRALAEHLRERLGVAFEIALTTPGATAADTGLGTRQKPRRLLDER